MSDLAINPAEEAAAATWNEVRRCLDENKNFRLEAGAGAGKTYSLIQALNYLIASRGKQLLRGNQRVACITYTNVATEEIEARTDRNPLVLAMTIHSFFWTMLKDFQPTLRQDLPGIPGWSERMEKAGIGEIGSRLIVYELGFPKIEEDRIILGHDDILALGAKLLGSEKFRRLLSSRFPIIFIDEYQDTDEDLASALKTHILNINSPLIGLFGDHLQKIYGEGCGLIEHPNLVIINKGANFRSVQTIVSCLNRIRPELPQYGRDPGSAGSVSVYHTNSWAGERRKGGHWKDDLPAEVAHKYLKNLVRKLTSDGWEFSPTKTKVLMLTHTVLAAEQGYTDLAGIFKYNDSFIKKKDVHIAFLIDVVEPVCRAYQDKRYGEMFRSLTGRIPSLRSHAEKSEWSQFLDRILELRRSASIGDMIDYLREAKRIAIPESVRKRETELSQRPTAQTEDPDSIETLRQMRIIPFAQITALHDFINNQTPFDTKHGVKGAEFENVLIVFGRGWNHYDFNQFLEWADGSVPPNKRDTYERNRNLFYVVCSRPIKRLSLLFTQKLSNAALASLGKLFESQNVHELTI